MSETLARLSHPTAADLARMIGEIADADPSTVYLVDSRTGATVTAVRLVERKLTDGSIVHDLRFDFAEEPPRPIRATPVALPRKRTDADSKSLRLRFVDLAAKAQLARGKPEEIALVRRLIVLLEQGAPITSDSAAQWRRRLRYLEAEEVES